MKVKELLEILKTMDPEKEIKTQIHMANGSGSIHSEVNLVKDENGKVWITSTDRIARLNKHAKNKSYVFEGEEDNIQVRLIHEDEYLKLPLPILFTTPEDVIENIDKTIESRKRVLSDKGFFELALELLPKTSYLLVSKKPELEVKETHHYTNVYDHDGSHDYGYRPFTQEEFDLISSATIAIVINPPTYGRKVFINKNPEMTEFYLFGYSDKDTGPSSLNLRDKVIQSAKDIINESKSESKKARAEKFLYMVGV